VADVQHALSVASAAAQERETERERLAREQSAREEAERANRAKDEFLAMPAAGAARAGRQPRRVLVVEDNQDGGEMLRVALEQEGHTIYEAANGEAGIAQALELGPDIALIDIGLPRLDGYEVARRIRKASAGKSITLVALTGYGLAEDSRRAEEAGFDLHLVKPVNAVKLADRRDTDGPGVGACVTNRRERLVGASLWPAVLFGRRGVLTRWSWVPGPVLFLTMLALWLANWREAYVAPPLVLFSFQFLFITCASWIVVFLVFRRFIANGSLGLLLLGCGALTWGLTSVVTNALSRGDVNVSRRSTRNGSRAGRSDRDSDDLRCRSRIALVARSSRASSTGRLESVVECRQIHRTRRPRGPARTA
jgi:CheY-like chemotaxis protein